MVRNGNMEYSGTGLTWKVKYNKATRYHKTWKEECILTAKKIYKDFNCPLIVQFSGGADSESTLRFCKEASVPFKALSVVFKKGFNTHEMELGIEFCKNNNIEHILLELDIEQFMLKDMFPYFQKYPRAATICVARSMWQVEQLQKQIDYDFVVVVGEDMYLHKNDRGYFYISEMEHRYGLSDFCEANNINLVQAFYKYTTEMMLAFIDEPYIQDFVRNSPKDFDRKRSDGTLIEDWHKYKNGVYHAIFDDFVSRDVCHGFELFEKNYEYTPKVRAVFEGFKATNHQQLYLNKIKKLEWFLL
jgi:hypothetical protein